MRRLLALLIVTRALQADSSEHEPGFIERGIGGLVNRATPAMLDVIDINAIVDQLDINAIADKLDLDALVDRLDLDALVDRLDLDALVDRLDLDALVDRLDLNAIVNRLDINAIADQLDLDALVSRIDIAPLVGKGSSEMATGGLDLARRQLIRIDVLIIAVVDRLANRKAADLPAGPGTQAASQPMADPLSEPMKGSLAAAPPGDIQGHYAGPLSRLVAAVIDSFGAVAVFGLLGSLTSFFVRYLTGNEITWDGSGWVRGVLLVIWLFAWYWIGQATTGRTPGKVVVGLRAVLRNDAPLGAGHALIRTLVLPISYIIFGLGFVGIVIGKERRGLHDVAAGSTVVYDWGDRRAQLPQMRLVAKNQEETSESPE